MKLLAFLFIAILTVDSVAQSESTIEVMKLGTGTNFKFKGLAIDTKSSVAYLGSWDKKEIVAISITSRKQEVLKSKYSGKLNGMDCYVRNGIVYAVMNEVDDDPNHQPISVLILFDMATRKMIRSYESKGTEGRNHFNHVVVDNDGIAYISNTLKSNLLIVNTKDPKDSLKVLIRHSDLSWVHGIDISTDGSKLFATAYDGGIKFLDLKTKTFSAFKDLATAGDDGLKYYQGFLYGVGQNSLKRYTLNKTETKVVKIDTLLKNHAYFNDPRCLHVEDGFLYCLANIEFEPVTFFRHNKHFSGAKLSDTYLIKLKVNN